MFYTKIKDVIPEKNIICISPHYDDFLFFLGGYILELQKKGLFEQKTFTNVSTFSRSNYQERDSQGNKDQSLKRIQYASGIRFIEDLECLDVLLGAHNYFYRVMGEEESQVRGKILNEGEGEMEMAFGSYENMDEHDEAILERMQKVLAEYMKEEDTAIILPLSMKGHIDHFIVREAGICAAREAGLDCKATVYFAEDKPYAGMMDEYESKINDDFIKENDLADKAFAHHPKTILKLAFKHYPSQVDEVYRTGIYKRSHDLKKFYNVSCECDRIYQYNNR